MGGGSDNDLAMLNGGDRTSFGLVFPWKLEVLAILNWGRGAHKVSIL